MIDGKLIISDEKSHQESGKYHSRLDKVLLVLALGLYRCHHVGMWPK